MNSDSNPHLEETTNGNSPSTLGRSALLVHFLSIVALLPSILSFYIYSRAQWRGTGVREAATCVGVSIAAFMVLWGWSLIMAIRAVRRSQNDPAWFVVIAAIAELLFALGTQLHGR